MLNKEQSINKSLYRIDECGCFNCIAPQFFCQVKEKKRDFDYIFIIRCPAMINNTIYETKMKNKTENNIADSLFFFDEFFDDIFEHLFRF